jgi:hypothetical protein
MALYLHTLVILWFAKHGRFNAEDYRRAHPWYAQTRTPSFADMPAHLKTASVKESISRYPDQKTHSLKKLLPRVCDSFGGRVVDNKGGIVATDGGDRIGSAVGFTEEASHVCSDHTSRCSGTIAKVI